MHRATGEMQRVFVRALTSVPSHRHVQDSDFRDLCVNSISGLKPPVPVLSCRSGRRSREEDVAGLKGDEVADDAQLFIDLVNNLAGQRIRSEERRVGKEC